MGSRDVQQIHSILHYYVLCEAICYFFFFFFFQAEDGIRDTSVTGVQTCALPISLVGGAEQVVPVVLAAAHQRQLLGAGVLRSEERRVGKECRSRGSAYHEKKKEGRGRGGSIVRDKSVK